MTSLGKPVALTARDVTFAVSSDCGRPGRLFAGGRTGVSVGDQLGLDPLPGLSPFAAQSGLVFERTVLADNAAAIADALAVHAVAPVKLERFDSKDPGYQNLSTQAVTSPSQVGVGLVEPGLPVTVAGQTLRVRPDLMVWTGDRWWVAEIKAYLVDGGYTDEARLAQAVGQAAVGVLAVQQHGMPVDWHVGIVRHDRWRKPVVDRVSAAPWIANINGLSVDAPVDLSDLAATPPTLGPDCTRRCGLAQWCSR